MDYELKAERVEEVLKDCLFTDEELKQGNGKAPEETIVVEGILSKFGFHPQRVENHKHEILDMLGQLPDAFKTSGGGGWSFLNACQDKNGRQWTSFHKTMEALFVLGIAIDKASYLMPRAMWSAFPGSMPYVVVDVI